MRSVGETFPDFSLQAVVSTEPGNEFTTIDTYPTPGGPFPAGQRATQSLVLVRDGAGWEIASFHNTLVAPRPPSGG